MSIDEKGKKKTVGVDVLGDPQKEEKTKETSVQTYTKKSVFDFMEFDKIEDNMIVQKNGKRFVMVVECQGINYDLMSGIERTGVEEGFMQFLNSLRYPIQLYIQTRTINLESSLQTYKQRLDNVKLELERKENEYKRNKESGQYTEEELAKQNLEVVRLKNLYEYGKDIVYYTETMSSNKNVLRKNYYVVIPYYVETTDGTQLLDKEEIRNMAFSELYTRAQSVASVLAACDVSCTLLDSYGLIDLLYASYNRDESEVYGINRAVQAGYDELYSTAPDILDKKMRAIDAKIEEKAYELATEVVKEAREDLAKEREIQRKEKKLQDLIEAMAISLVQENAQYIGKETAEIAKEKIDKRKTNDVGASIGRPKKGDGVNVKKEAKRAKRVAS